MNESMLAVISGSSILELFVTVVLCGLAYWVLEWGITTMALGEFPSKILRVIVGLAIVVFVVNAIFNLSGSGGFIRWR